MGEYIKKNINYKIICGNCSEELKSKNHERILYSKSEQFHDFLFKARKSEDTLICGSLLELRDSKGGNVASFNSTLPSKTKNKAIKNMGNLINYEKL